ncbi:MAG: hypothetical protein ABI639_07385 [Thermoanaerobaculia bacterium]
MDGGTTSRSLRAMGAMAANPRHAWLWLQDRLRPRSPIEKALPWTSWASIQYLDSIDLTDRTVFEYGGGGSTLYFLRRGCVVTTVENNEAWASRIRERAGPFAQRLTLKVIDMPEHPDDSFRSLANAYVNSVNCAALWDIILVDGADGDLRLRMECLAISRQLSPPGGLVILDDSWRREYVCASTIMDGFSRRQFRSLGPARLGVTQTDIYRRN